MKFDKQTMMWIKREICLHEKLIVVDDFNMWYKCLDCYVKISLMALLTSRIAERYINSKENRGWKK